MKRSFVILLMGAVLCGGCAQSGGGPVAEPEPVETQVEEEVLPEGFAGEYVFTSGAGAWQELLQVADDGTFSGKFTDSDFDRMSVSEYTGRLDQFEKVSDTVWKAVVTDFQVTSPTGTQEEQDGMLVEYTDPYGMDGVQSVTVYLPGADFSSVSDEIKGWIPVSSMLEDGKSTSSVIVNDQSQLPFVKTVTGTVCGEGNALACES